ncbi:cytosolic beta-glucosidase-like [Melospiza georgiana]|uniref:cytosolic beta-glucosidase-like n=1 Tax=Melospiza georgiana TaxID=44398 RepID=UPI0025AC2B65|nr:cytosolic beta-glucosidase-like [Melospiza georgiana]
MGTLMTVSEMLPVKQGLASLLPSTQDVPVCASMYSVCGTQTQRPAPPRRDAEEAARGWEKHRASLWHSNSNPYLAAGGATATVLEDIAFPVEFAWGAATAAYQIEEGWNADGKGPNVWDIFTHQGGDGVFKNQTGDVACGSYTLWEEDLKCIKQLGLTHYCFSLSWSRLLPDGTTGFINQKGSL